MQLPACASVVFALLVALVASDHCGPQQTLAATCGSDGCENGWYINGVLTPNLVLTTGCSYSITVAAAGGSFQIWDLTRTNLYASHTSNFNYQFSSRGNYIYVAGTNQEIKGHIVVVTDGVWSGWSCCDTCNSGGSQSRTCSTPTGYSDWTGTFVNGDSCSGSGGTKPCDVSGTQCNVIPTWSSWSSCGGSNFNSGYDCGTGTQSRSCSKGGCQPGCGTEPGGDTSTSQSCQGSSNGGSVCNGNWGNWGNCPACGPSNFQVTRRCNNPPASNGGAPCSGSSQMTCSGLSLCDGVWSNWNSNGCPSCYCTTPCNSTRSCTCNSPLVPPCNPCSGSTQQPNPMCVPANGAWNGWQACSCTLNGGDACMQTRTCGNPNSGQCANSFFCPGSSLQAATSPQCSPRYWTPWSGCNEPECTEGGGLNKRYCLPALPYLGLPCADLTNDTLTCNTDPCDGVWGVWSSCTTTCGGGTQTRTCRSSVNGGVNCTDLDPAGVHFEQACNTHACGCILDMCFALDGSASILAQSWDQLKLFSTKLLTLINAGNGTQVAVVQFSDALQTRVEGGGMTSSLQEALNDINGMTQLMGSTAIGEGIMMCHQQINAHDRKNIANVILVITDGTENEGPNCLMEADLAKANGTEIFVIGVGGDTNFTSLYDMASYPKLGVHLFNISGYDVLDSISETVTEGLCFGRPQAAAAANFYPFFALLAILPLGFGIFVVRRRRAKPKVVPPPPPRKEAPPPPPPVKTAAPKPITDKPKDWTVPGTRYIGFGQANIKVKWGTEAPPSAPRGHDKYDRWSMMAHPEGMKPPAGAPGKAMDVETAGGAGAAGGGALALADVGRRKGCCERFFPCCCAPKALNQTAAKTGNKKAAADDDEEENWQSNPAAS